MKSCATAEMTGITRRLLGRFCFFSYIIRSVRQVRRLIITKIPMKTTILVWLQVNPSVNPYSEIKARNSDKMAIYFRLKAGLRV